MTVNIEPVTSKSAEVSQSSGFAALLFVLGFPHMYGAMKYRKYHKAKIRPQRSHRIGYSVLKAFVLTFFDLLR